MQYSRLRSIIFMLMLTIWNNFDLTSGDDATKLDHSENYKTCTSEICKIAGNEIASNLDNKIDPCDNFYQHACGNWASNHAPPPNINTWSPLSEVITRVALDTLEMLEGDDTAETETLQKIRDLYQSCMNFDDISAAGLTPVANLVSSNGGWPVTFPSTDWHVEDTNRTFQQVLEYYMKTIGTAGFFKLHVATRRSRPRNYSLLLEVTDLFITEDDNNSTILDVAIRLSELRGFNRSHSDVEKEITEMIDFANMFENTYGTVTNSMWEERMSLVELQNTWNKAISGSPEYAINWLEMIRGLFDGASVTIEETEEITIFPRDFISGLGKLLKNNSLRTVVNYVHSSAILKKLNNVLIHHRSDENITDWNLGQRIHYCISTHGMVEGILSAYAVRHLPANLPLTMTYIVSTILDEMKRQINQSTWIDNESKLGITEKVNNILTLVGNPSWFNEPEKMDKFYSELKIGSDYFENILNIDKFNIITNLKTLRKSHYEKDVRGLVTSQTPFLNLVSPNALFFDLRALQLPFYHPERPAVLNFGAIGTVIGHEAAHIFDEKGVISDIYGDVVVAWSNTTKDEYAEKIKCFVEQYSNYTILEKHGNKTWNIDGAMLLLENIADNIGFATALDAYLSYKEQYNYQDIRIPELTNFTDTQLFFYSFSNLYCEIPPDYKIPEVISSIHSFFPARVNVCLRNTPKFAEAFKCPIGSPMNPVKKCIFWE